MNKQVSLHLEITGSGSDWKWKLFFRSGGGNSCIVSEIAFPQTVLPHDLQKGYFAIDVVSYTRLYDYGTFLTNAVLPDKVREILQNCESGELMFVVPEIWASIPFELMVINNGFISLKYKIGTVLQVNGFSSFRKIENRRLSVGVIADPAGDLHSAYHEGIHIRDLLRNKNVNVSLLSISDKVKLRQLLCSNSIVHFAGHSLFSESSTDGGWKISDGIYFNISEIECSVTEAFPLLVFSNSCEGGRTSAGLAGVAGAFMKSGSSQFIGPSHKVVDNESLDCAKVYYSNLLQCYSPAESLLTMKTNLIKRDCTGALLYRLFGDPTWKIPNAGIVPHSAKQDVVSPGKSKHRISKRLVFLVIAFLLLIIALFIPFGNDTVLYIPPPQ